MQITLFIYVSAFFVQVVHKVTSRGEVLETNSHSEEGDSSEGGRSKMSTDE